MEILNTYTNKQGRIIPVRNIHFATLDDFENYKGTCIIENTRNNIFATTKNNPYVACISIPTYDEKKALKYYVENGKYYAEFKFTNESAYNDANNELFKQGQIYYILSIMSLKNKNIDVKNIKYSNNDNLCIITIFFDKANN